jgi:hypothetical protein
LRDNPLNLGKKLENMEKVGQNMEKVGKIMENHGKVGKLEIGFRKFIESLIYIRDYDCLSLLQSTTTDMENIIRLRLDFCRASQVLSKAEEGPCSHGVQKFRTIGPKE